MADFALTLPDHDLTANEFKELARRVGRAAFVPLFVRYYERVMTSEATIEEQRRGLADIARWVGVEEDRKVDPNANLPVFNIIFGAPSAHGNTSMQVVDVTPAAPPEPEPAAGSLASVLDPHEIEIIHKLMEPPHGQATSDPPPAPPDEGEVRADAPGKRRNVRHARERSPALRDAVRPAAGIPASQDGEPLVSQAGQASDPAPEEMTLEEQFAQLDKELGL